MPRPPRRPGMILRSCTHGARLCSSPSLLGSSPREGEIRRAGIPHVKQGLEFDCKLVRLLTPRRRGWSATRIWKGGVTTTRRRGFQTGRSFRLPGDDFVSRGAALALLDAPRGGRRRRRRSSLIIAKNDLERHAHTLSGGERAGGERLIHILRANVQVPSINLDCTLNSLPPRLPPPCLQTLVFIKTAFFDRNKASPNYLLLLIQTSSSSSSFASLVGRRCVFLIASNVPPPPPPPLLPPPPPPPPPPPRRRAPPHLHRVGRIFMQVMMMMSV